MGRRFTLECIHGSGRCSDAKFDIQDGCHDPKDIARSSLSAVAPVVRRMDVEPVGGNRLPQALRDGELSLAVELHEDQASAEMKHRAEDKDAAEQQLQKDPGRLPLEC